MPDPFISTQDLSDYLGRDVTSDDGAIMAVDAACDIVRDIAEQDFNQTTYTTSLDGNNLDCLLLAQRPVTAVSSVSVDGTAIDSDDYVFTAGGKLLRNKCDVWRKGRQNVAVTYTAGYATDDVPRSIRMVALQIAARYVIQGVAESEVVGDVQLSYGMNAADLTQNELRILNKYRAARSF